MIDDRDFEDPFDWVLGGIQYMSDQRQVLGG